MKQLQRDEIAGVLLRAGFLIPGQCRHRWKAETWWAVLHSMAPDFVAEQIDRSRANLDVDTIDVFYAQSRTPLGFVNLERI